MHLRSQLRALPIQAAALIHADKIALRLQQRQHRQHGVVVGMHETPRALEARFRKQLEWVARHFTISHLHAFAQLWQNPESHPQDKPPILFTFDDGRESNYHVAAPLLESFGGRGVFFVVPAFAECSAGDALDFYRSRINPDSRPGDETWEDWRPMTREQIADLAARGHAIGNHTLTHRRLIGLSRETLQREIGESARKIEAWTQQPVDAFAWTFGWDSIDPAALKMIHRKHRFCFAPCAGRVDPVRDHPSLIWRREIEVKYSAAEYRFLHSGLADPWWSMRRRQLRGILQNSIDAA
jgi:peptidoglycan/xylan/chitin deacetylase (PgdA/CDA1 family)